MFRWTLGIVAVALLFGLIGFGPRALGQALPTPRGQLGGKEPLEPSPSPPAPPPPIVLPSPAPPPLARNDGARPRTVAVTGAPRASATVTSEPAASAPVAAAKASTVTLYVERADDGSLASGWVLDTAGHVVTSARAVDGADRIEAIAPDGRRSAASVVAADELSGVAVLAAPDLALPPLPLAESDAAMGEPVFAAGTAGEGLAGTVSRGIVSSGARWLPDAYAATPLLQHDAAVAPAMAGGPLLNAAGEVVGMTVLVDDERGEDGIRLLGIGDDADSAAPARSFAVPVSTLRAVAPALIERGRVDRPWFGVGMVPVTVEEASRLGLPAAAGVVVAVVAPESPAAEAGIAEGDVILEVDGEPLTPERGFVAALAGRTAGETVAVRLLRQGTEQTVAVTLGEAPQAG